MGTRKTMEIITLNGIISGYSKCCVSYYKKERERDLHFNVCSSEQLRAFSELLIPRTSQSVVLYILTFACSLVCQYDDHI